MSPSKKSLNPYRKKLNTIYSLIAVSIIALVIVVYYQKKDQGYTEELIHDVFSKTESDIITIMNPIHSALVNVKYDNLSNKVSLDNYSDMNKYFSDILANLDGLSSVFIGDSRGRQYILYRDKKSWISGERFENQTESKVEWSRWENFKNPISNWAEVIDYDTRDEIWYQNLKIEFSDTILWTQTHQFFSTKNIGTTGVIFWINELSGDTLYCAANLSLNTLNKSSAKLNKYSGRTAFILTQHNHYITIPSKGDSLLQPRTTFISNLDFSKNQRVEKILSEWQKLGDERDITFSFSGEEDLMWNRIEKLNTNNASLILGISISETELLFSSSLYYIIILYSLIALIVVQIVLLAVYYFRKKKFQNLLDETQVWKEYDPNEIAALIKNGENANVEFKSSLRWDYKENKVNKHLEEVILKSISAFNNGNGGTLVIGVDDDENILGIEKDYLSLRKKNIDYFEIHIRNLFNQIFGINFTTTQLKISFPICEAKPLCIVEIAAGVSPIFLTVTDNKGRQSEAFFIRSGNTSQKVESLTEINNYISQRFSKKSNSDSL